MRKSRLIPYLEQLATGRVVETHGHHEDKADHYYKVITHRLRKEGWDIETVYQQGYRLARKEIPRMKVYIAGLLDREKASGRRALSVVVPVDTYMSIMVMAEERNIGLMKMMQMIVEHGIDALLEKE